MYLYMHEKKLVKIIHVRMSNKKW